MKQFIPLIIAILIISPRAEAATISAETEMVSVGIGSTLDVRVSVFSKEAPINAVSGQINLPDGLSLVSIGFENSVIGLWLTKPSLSEGVINFSGIIPGGFSGVLTPGSKILSPGTLFSLKLRATQAGTFEVKPLITEAFRHSSSSESISFQSVPVKIISDSKGKFIENNEEADSLPPEPFAIFYGQDNSIYGGKKFITFATTDSGSGLYFYTVEEKGYEPVTAESPYLLKDQSGRSPIVVRAYDTAGNVQESRITGQKSGPSLPVYYLIAAIAFVLSLCAAIIFLRVRR